MRRDAGAFRTSTVAAMLTAPAAPSQAMIVTFGFVLGVVLLIAPPAFSQSPTAIPDNAHARSYGDGWDCDRTFRLEGAACVPVVVPANAYATKRTYGVGWACLHGYRESEAGTCLEVVVPDGGYLEPSGDGWTCLRGHAKQGDECLRTDLPENAYLSESTYGVNWTCERGYEPVGRECLAIVVPENGYLNNAGYGQPWSCERGYVERRGACDAVVIPENAYFDGASYGPGWRCERGYSVAEDRCIAMTVPDNAHLDRTGNRWACNKSFQQSQGQCVLNK